MIKDCEGNEILHFCGSYSTTKYNYCDIKEGEENPIFTFAITLINVEGDSNYAFYIRKNHFFDAPEKGTLLITCPTQDYASREQAIDYMINYVMRENETSFLLEDWEVKFILNEKRSLCC